MPSPKSLAVASLKHLARQCVREQMRYKVIRSARRQMQSDERATLRRIKTIKARIDRELVASARLLGINPEALDD